MDLVHMFVRIAAAPADNEFGYPCGERHAILLFCRRPTGSDYDFDLAFSEVEGFGWTDVNLTRAGTVDPSATFNDGESVSNEYQTALEAGRYMIIYSEAEPDFL